MFFSTLVLVSRACCRRRENEIENESMRMREMNGRENESMRMRENERMGMRMKERMRIIEKMN